MKLTLLITPEALLAGRLHTALAEKRDPLARQGIAVSRAMGAKNASRLWMAITDPDHVDPLRAARGYASPEAQARLLTSVRRELANEAKKLAPEHLVISCAQGVMLRSEAELARLAELLGALSDDVRILCHIDEQARTLVRAHAHQVWEGRIAGLEQELALAAEPDWATAALAARAAPDPDRARFPEVDAPPFWLDWAALSRRWETAFGAGRVVFRPHDPSIFNSAEVTREVEAMLGAGRLGKIAAAPPADPPSDLWLERCRQVNALFLKVLESGRLLPRPLWRRMMVELALPGPGIAPGALSPISRHFAETNAALAAADPALAQALAPDAPQPDWTAPDPAEGFRASQYLAAWMPRIDKATADARAADEKARKEAEARKPQSMSPQAEAILPPLAQATFTELAGGRFAPHNRLGKVDETAAPEPYPEMPPRRLPEGSSGNVIVACMKNEGPYILEWVAYHRAIGVDNFLIYTNGCEDGTDEILGRLQGMGLLQHRLNDEWKGKSPQQAALNKSLKEPVIRNAEWLIHIDVDEFMNIRTGGGTLPDLFAAVPDATNIAMTWRLFGHGGVTQFSDRPVIEQFTRCAPAWCPKPHTVWGFKTMFRNTGAYAKMSCHRPNHLAEDRRSEVRWVNGSGRPMGESLKDRGWRSGTGDIGYDLIQLNHYALRSADSFLIKRQRGRALHVDRSIGLNYWIRMDWSDATDLTIQRNLPRLRTEMARLLADPELARHHAAAVAWHRDKAAKLKQEPEFEDLYAQALATKLSGLERVAYSLALDLES